LCPNLRTKVPSTSRTSRSLRRVPVTYRSTISLVPTTPSGRLASRNRRSRSTTAYFPETDTRRGYATRTDGSRVPRVPQTACAAATRNKQPQMVKALTCRIRPPTSGTPTEFHSVAVAYPCPQMKVQVRDGLSVSARCRWRELPHVFRTRKPMTTGSDGVCAVLRPLSAARPRRA
jgi:hypothetical protein